MADDDFLNYDASKVSIECGWNWVCKEYDMYIRPDYIEFWGIRHKGALKQYQAVEELTAIAKALATAKHVRGVKVEHWRGEPWIVTFTSAHISLTFDMEANEDFDETPSAKIFVNRVYKWV